MIDPTTSLSKASAMPSGATFALIFVITLIIAVAAGGYYYYVSVTDDETTDDEKKDDGKKDDRKKDDKKKDDENKKDDDEKEELDEEEAPLDYQGKEIAFEGAEGFGSYTRGGRGGKVYYVTSLSDDNKTKGTLRYAIEKEDRPLIVRFKVSGTIKLEKTLQVKDGMITIDGSTGPGKGICLSNGTLKIMANEVIVRYIRVRPMVVDGGDAVNIGGSWKNIMIDHCSCSWSGDEIVSVFGDAVDAVTIQYCFIYEAFGSGKKVGGHQYGSLLVPGSNGHLSALYNLYAHNESRNPRTGNARDAQESSYLDFRNNLIYNYGATPGYNGQDEQKPSRINFVNNVYESGPSSVQSKIIFEERGSKLSRGYFEGNSLNGKTPDDPYSLVKFTDWETKDIKEYKKTEALETVNTTTHDTKNVKRFVLENAGCTLPERDDADESVISDVEDGKGTIVLDYDKYKLPAL